MPLGAIRVSCPLPASAARVYSAWLETREHSLMTGSAATVDPRVGGRTTAWDGYIEGEILELEPGVRIVQAWRSTDFPAGHPPSRLEIRVRDVAGGCEISLSHSEIPEGEEEKYAAGWQEFYFIPMTKYFRETRESPSVESVGAEAGGTSAEKGKRAPAKKRRVAKRATKVKKPRAVKKSATKPKKAARSKVAAKKATGAKKPTTSNTARKTAKPKKAAKRAKKRAK